jgi:hypothetical protein
MQGSCLCGDVAWELAPPLEQAGHCHCGICRKHHGVAFQSFAAAGEAGFRWLRGQGGIQRYESSPGFFRSFCGRCGSKVPSDASEGRIFVWLGNLDGDPGVRPQAHIFAASKAPWYEISDTLPRFDAWPPGFDAPVQPDRVQPPAPPGRVGGSCLCGALAYEIELPIPMLRNCHCSRCRKARGAAHASNAVTAIDRFHWLRGEDQVASYKVPEARFFTQSFCRRCGSAAPRLDPGRAIAIVPAGSFDGDPGVRVMEHIFTGSKAPWFEILDALPRHAEGAPAR